MRKLLSLFFLVGLSVTMLHAQNTLNVHSKSGDVVSYAFAEKPVITYLNDVLVLTTLSTTVEYPLQDLLKLTFDDDKSDIEVVTHRSESDMVRIYSVKGQLLRAVKADEDGVTSLVLGEMAPGIYIVKNGSTSYKIVKK